MRNIVGLGLVEALALARAEQLDRRVGRVVEAHKDGLADVRLGRRRAGVAVAVEALAVGLADLLGGEVCFLCACVCFWLVSPRGGR